MSINVPFTNTDFEPSFDRTQRDVLRRLLNMLAAAVPSELPIDTAGAEEGDTLIWSSINQLFEPSSRYSRVEEVADTSYSLQPGDNGKFIRFTSDSAVTFTIENEGGETPVLYRDNTQIEFEQAGAGAVSIVGASGVTININPVLTPISNGQYAVAGLKRVGENEWTLFGNLVLAV